MDTFRFFYSCTATGIYVFILSLSLVNAASKVTRYERFADARKLPISLAQLEEKSLPQCTIYCENEPECSSVNYNSAEKKCELSEHYPEIVVASTDDYGVKAEHLTIEQASDWAIYYKPNPSCDFGNFTVLLASETVGTITSPNYPNNYEINDNRFWLFIKPSHTSTLHLEFKDFKVGNSPCNWDRVIIYDGACKSRPLLHPVLCASKTDERIVDTIGIYVLLNLVSDHVVTFKGFLLNYYVS